MQICGDLIFLCVEELFIDNVPSSLLTNFTGDVLGKHDLQLRIVTLYLTLRSFTGSYGVSSSAPPWPDRFMLSRIRERVRIHSSSNSGCHILLGVGTSLSFSNCLTVASCFEDRLKRALATGPM